MNTHNHHNTTNIKAFVFDIGNVICTLHLDRLETALRSFSSSTKTGTSVMEFLATSGLLTQLETDAITLETFFDTLKHEYELTIDYASFTLLWNNIFSLNREIEKIIAALHRRYPLFFLSNTNRIHFETIKRQYPDVIACFKQYFLSYEIGYCKPDVRIYETVKKNIPCAPEACIYIDDIPQFVDVGKSLGFVGIQFQSITQLYEELERYGVMTFAYNM